MLRQINLSLQFIGCFLFGFLPPLLPQLVIVPRRPKAVKQRQKGRQELNHALGVSERNTAATPARPATAVEMAAHCASDRPKASARAEKPA